MKKTLIKAILIASFFSITIAEAVPIKSIEINGLNTISRGTVLSYLPLEVGDDYNQQSSSEIISALYKTDFFKDIEVSQNNQVLTINIQENPSIKSIELLNYSNKVIEKDSVEKTLKSMGLTQGKIFNKRQLDKLVSEIEASYINQGYYNTKITKNVETDIQNRVSVSIDIKEGEIARIKSMKISGAKVYDEQDLLDLFKIGEPDFFIVNYFTNKDHYSKLAFDAGIEEMKSLYINDGYLDFKVDETSTELTEDKQNINIHIQISEGTQYKVGKISFSGNLLDQSTEDITKLLSIKTGDIFKRKEVVQSIQNITDLFANKSHLLSKVDASTAKDTEARVVDLDINITPNQKIYINRITIAGNTRTQDDVIRREINIAEGGLYSSADVNKSISKIKRLGYFSDVKMEVAKVPGFADKIDLHFTVKEAKTGAFTIGFSQSNERGTSFELGIKEKNFLGTGNILNAKLASSKAVKEVSFYFLDPYFTEDGHSINYGVFSKSVDGGELDVSDYEIDETGFNAGYGLPITENTRVGVDLRASSRDITCGHRFGGTNGPAATTTTPTATPAGFMSQDPRVFDRPIGANGEYTETGVGGTRTQTVNVTDSDNYIGRGFETEQCANGDKTEVKLNVNWGNNTLNNYNFPTEGQKNRLSFDLTLPIADFRYYKFDVSHRSYYPLSDDLTLNLKGNLGIGSGYGGKELPFFKRYYGGGSSSIRGFEFNSLGATYPDGNAVGGEFSLLGGVSVVSPLKLLSDSKNIRVSGFVDLGTIEEKADFGFDSARASAGVSFTWLTPIGPLGIYYAEPLIKKSDDKIKSFEFTIGTTF